MDRLKDDTPSRTGIEWSDSSMIFASGQACRRFIERAYALPARHIGE